MNRYIVEENATGDLYFVYADTEDRVYQLMAKTLGMDEEDFDPGDVDINIMKTDPNVEVMKIEFKE